MAVEFDGLASLALHLLSTEVAEVVALQHGLGVCARKIEQTAKSEIGHYQDAAGPFPEWAELADSTEQDKAAHGYPVDAPLLRSGEMRENITHEVHGLEAVIGSTDPKMVYHEFGTAKMPPRPVMGPAAFRNKDFILRTIGKAAVTGLVGGERIHPSLGYED